MELSWVVNGKKYRMAMNGGRMVDDVFQWRWSVLAKGGREGCCTSMRQ